MHRPLRSAAAVCRWRPSPWSTATSLRSASAALARASYRTPAWRNPSPPIHTLRCPPHATTLAIPLRCPQRHMGSSSSGSDQRISVTASELRVAFRTLQLNEDCTDAEVKRAFQAFALQHHPDQHATAPPSSSFSQRPSRAEPESTDRMRRGTEAYHLLRHVPFDVRQRILQESLRSGSRGERRFRGPFNDFHFTEEEYAKAQRVYEGGHRRRHGKDNTDDDDLFDTHTEEGRRRAERFQQVKMRIHEMRRRGRRDDLPPWRVCDTPHSTADFNASASASSGTFDRSSRAPENEPQGGRSGSSTSSSSPGGGPRNPNRLGLAFFHSTVSNLKNVRALYHSRPGFAGMDGSAYDNPHSAARAAAELSANPHLRQYILMKQRAQEKAVVDGAVRQPLFLFVALLCIGGTALMMLGTVRSILRRARNDEETQRLAEERGGA